MVQLSIAFDRISCGETISVSGAEGMCSGSIPHHIHLNP